MWIKKLFSLAFFKGTPVYEVQFGWPALCKGPPNRMGFGKRLGAQKKGWFTSGPLPGPTLGLKKILDRELDTQSLGALRLKDRSMTRGTIEKVLDPLWQAFFNKVGSGKIFKT